MDPNVLHNLSYGMYIVAANKGELLNGQIANTVFQITSEPQTIAISINKQNLTYEFLQSAAYFSVSILAEETPLPFIGKFGFKSGHKEDKFKDTKFKLLDSGCPVVLENAVSYLEAKIVNRFDCGTHTLFLGQITASEIINKAGKPMTYEYYHMVKHGTTPPKAPTFIRGEK